MNEAEWIIVDAVRKRMMQKQSWNYNPVNGEYWKCPANSGSGDGREKWDVPILSYINTIRRSEKSSLVFRQTDSLRRVSGAICDGP